MEFQKCDVNEKKEKKERKNEQRKTNKVVKVIKKLPGTGEPGGLLFMGSHRVGHD